MSQHLVDLRCVWPCGDFVPHIWSLCIFMCQYGAYNIKMHICWYTAHYVIPSFLDFPKVFPIGFQWFHGNPPFFSVISTIHSLILSIIPKPFLYIAMISPGFYDFPSYPLVNVYITMEKHHFQWVNPLFLWPFSSSQTVNVYHYFYGHFQ